MKAFLWLTGVALAAFSMHLFAQCTKDIECRGDRICEKGVCVFPPAKSSGEPTRPSSAATPKPTSGTPSFNDYRVEYTDRAFPFQVPSTGNRWLDERQEIPGPRKPNFAGHYYVATAGCGTGCRFYRLFDLATKKEYSLPFGGEQETKGGDGYTTYLEFEKDSTLIRAIYSLSLKSGGTDCRQRYFTFRDGTLSSVSQTTPTKHDFCS